MPTRIRLQRHGKKGRPFYHIVVADGRAPRDGKFIEKIGTYNPISIPAEISLNFDRAVYWMQTGASPSETAKSLLRQEGVLHKIHLLKGAQKGAFTPEMAEVKFNEWLEAKKARFVSELKAIELNKKTQSKKQVEAEAKINEARIQKIAEKRAKEVQKQVEEAQEKMAEEAAGEETPQEHTEA